MLNKANIAIVCIFAMVGGFLVSRFMLSVGMILFGINALWGVPPRQWLQNKWWLLGLCWMAMYAISGIWSDDKETWSIYLQMKLPIVLMPVAFSLIPAFTTKQLQVLATGIAAMLLAGISYSLSYFVRDYAHFIEEYNVSHLLPTPGRNDYICFSLMIVLFNVWVLHVWPSVTEKAVKWFLGVAMVIMVVYLHILAAKSGIIALYVFIITWGVYAIIVKKNMAGLIALIALPLVVIFAIKYIPTFTARKEHLIYTYYRFRSNDKSGHLGDISRLMSYDISLKLIKQHPLAGVGMGDVLTEMKKGYDQWYPEVEDQNRLIPHNQFLTIALGCGIPGMLIFLAWLIMPLTQLKRERGSFFFFATWLLLFIQLMIEPFLEGQFGVFVFILFLLLQRHSLKYNKNIVFK